MTPQDVGLAFSQLDGRSASFAAEVDVQLVHAGAPLVESAWGAVPVLLPVIYGQLGCTPVGNRALPHFDRVASVSEIRADRLEVDRTMLLAVPDYDQAVAEFVRQTVDGMMAASDPIYASLRRLSLPEGVGTIRVEVGDAATRSPEVHLSQEVQVRRSDVVEGNLEQFHDVLAQIAESHLLQFMRPFFEHVGEAAEAVGNSVEISGSTLGWDDLLDAHQKVEWAVDATGTVRPPQVVVGSAVAARLRDLPEMTPEQQERTAAMVLQKQEEHVSRRRGRRLR